MTDEATADAPDVLVLRQNIHGIPPESYVAALRERLPDREVGYAATPDEERELLPDAQVLAGFELDEERLDRAENLELFACSYAGVDHLPLEAFRERGVAVTNASGVHGPNIGEYALGAILSFTRGFLESRRRQRRREWRSHQAHELAGSTVAVVGMGSIGESVVQRLRGFEVDTVGVRYSPEKGGPTDEVYGYDEIAEAVADAAYVVLACPLTDETEDLVDEEVFLTMPPEAVLVNVARGGVVDTDALVDALRWNSIRGAALDVTDPEPLPEDHELWTFENVLITPHNAGHTPQYFERLADIVAEAVATAEESGEWADLPNQVV
ncbi:D-2-hydroxyacid dehydrogenase [Halosimplex halophilum]|uniref:D-2-hydroxyacid dehydrogenase n=1 Tax=Halosimplex halophilum TaxID=2559572 RepID=UPI00107FB5B2|nr:D-2-hydroxyacid dehydrogenase [Halosimplex halophilum]